MATVVTVRWLTPPPSAIDERLTVTDDGRGRLEVLRPRAHADSIGTYEGAIEQSEIRDLSVTGPAVELNVVVQDPAVAAVGVVAGRVAERLHNSPVAVAQFFARAVGDGSPAGRSIAIGVAGRGTQPIEFELDVDQCAIHFSAAGVPISWSPLPELPIGFMTPDAEGLGGVRQRATVPPGVLGAISVQLPIPDGAQEVSAHLVGRWFLSSDPMPAQFEARTEPAGW